MQTAIRGSENPALDTAQHEATARGLPLVLVAYLRTSSAPPGYATERRYKFVLEGLRDVQTQLEALVLFWIYFLLKHSSFEDLEDPTVYVITVGMRFPESRVQRSMVPKRGIVGQWEGYRVWSFLLPVQPSRTACIIISVNVTPVNDYQWSASDNPLLSLRGAALYSDSSLLHGDIPFCLIWILPQIVYLMLQGLPVHVFLEGVLHTAGDTAGLRALLRNATLIVTEDMPCPPYTAWLEVSWP